MTMNTETLHSPTGADLIAAVLNGVRAREGTKAARDVARQMLAGITGILLVEFGPVELNKMLADAERCAAIAVAEIPEHLQ
jgi:hypothetical protein